MSEGVAECTEKLDPRVQIELERLNTATDEINRLEVELDEARLAFRRLLAEGHLRIQQLTKKLGTSVHKARPYYEARFRANIVSISNLCFLSCSNTFTYSCYRSEYQAKLKHFQMLSLVDRRCITDMTILQKLVNGNLEAPELLHTLSLSAMKTPRFATCKTFYVNSEDRICVGTPL
uniref:SH3 domain-binding protein 5-like protein n=1 Tax=Pararge aegeria TaxID=116150 RepID=S4PP18_9NEOP